MSSVRKTGAVGWAAEVSDDELALINRLTRRPLGRDEVYHFSIVLCDNDIDRDFERFDVEALQALGTLFVGKTGIFDHNPTAANQQARIYDAQVERVDGVMTRDGQAYHRLVARAYMVRTARNEDLILEIEAGIKKEVSVGCSCAHAVCSVCGADAKGSPCGHRPGRMYTVGGCDVLCYRTLQQPTDAYEWSFVAVPAQRHAGVVKSYTTKGDGMESICKRLEGACDDIVLTADDCRALCEEIGALEKDAAWGRRYRDDLTREVVRFAAIAQPQLDAAIVKSVADKMDVDELTAFKKAVEGRALPSTAAKPQLAAAAGKPGGTTHSAFKM